MSRLPFREVFARVQNWLSIFQQETPVEFRSDIGAGTWVRIQPNLAVVLSKKSGAFFLQLLRGKSAERAPKAASFVACARESRRLSDMYPCVKHHISFIEDPWRRKGEFHVSVYEDPGSRAMKLLFDLYFLTCFPKNHPQRRKHPTNFRTRVVHIYFEVDASGQNVRLSRTHPDSRCFMVLDQTSFSARMFDLIQGQYSRVNHETLDTAWRTHLDIMEDVRMMMQIFGAIMLPIPNKKHT